MWVEDGLPSTLVSVVHRKPPTELIIYASEPLDTQVDVARVLRPHFLEVDDLVIAGAHDLRKLTSHVGQQVEV